MHIHILGICGTFMAGIASIAKEAGHKVTGADQNVYPPMSDFLQSLAIDVHQGYDAEQLDEYQADICIVGNVMTRGYPVIEALLNRKLSFMSGPQWLYENVLKHQTVIAVSGTHGKTTTTSMLTWLLEAHGLNPGFLIGGMPANFDVTARLGGGKYFVIEADEYDTAFFDKRSKFINYKPDVVLVNNLEFDHADIFSSIDDIKRQFHHMLRCVPASGRIIFNGDDKEVVDLVNMGCWTPLSVLVNDSASTDNVKEQVALSQLNDKYSTMIADKWSLQPDKIEHSQIKEKQDYNRQDDLFTSYKTGNLPVGSHNKQNALAAIACAACVGVSAEKALQYFADYRLPKRRLEKQFSNGQLTVYRDFAHHPTAIKNTLQTLTEEHPSALMITAIEMRSNSMKAGVHDQLMQQAVSAAANVFILAANNEQQQRLQKILTGGQNQSIEIFASSADCLNALILAVQNHPANKCVAFLTNGSFDKITEQFVEFVELDSQKSVKSAGT